MSKVVKMDYKNKINWKLWIPLLLFIGLVIDFYFLHILFREKNKQLFLEDVQKMGFTQKIISPFKEMNQKLTTIDKTNAPTPLIAEQFKKCFANNKVKLNSDLKITNPTELFNLLKQNMANDPFVRIENYIFLDNYGIEHRLHITPNEKNNNRQVQLYKLDIEGYPTKISLPDLLNGDQWQNHLEDFLKNNKVIFHQVKAQLNTVDQFNVQYELHNDLIFRMQITNSQAQLNCDQESCHCQD